MVVTKVHTYLNKPEAALVWMTPCFKRVKWQNFVLRKVKNTYEGCEHVFNKVAKQLVCHFT